MAKGSRSGGGKNGSKPRWPTPRHTRFDNGAKRSNPLLGQGLGGDVPVEWEKRYNPVLSRWELVPPSDGRVI